MTNSPTQVQIEAAKLIKTLRELHAARAEPWDDAQTIWSKSADTIEKLTAAARVGEQDRDQLEFKLRKVLVAATIERCAQEVDDGTVQGKFYAAKVRKLKDNP